jgi:hypothetical protein
LEFFSSIGRTLLFSSFGRKLSVTVLGFSDLSASLLSWLHIIISIFIRESLSWVQRDFGDFSAAESQVGFERTVSAEPNTCWPSDNGCIFINHLGILHCFNDWASCFKLYLKHHR